VYLWVKLKLSDMKNNFIELTSTENSKVFINLDNVIEIVQEKDYTSLFTNCPFNTGLFIITVKETYDTIKRLIEAQI